MDHEFSFNGQRPEEKVLQVVKNHPLVIFLPGLKLVLFVFVATVLILVWKNQYSGLVGMVFAVMGLGIFSRSYYNFSQSVLIITNQRLMYVDQIGFWKRKIIEAEINRIQSVSSDLSGMFKVIFKYGNLIVKTAGTGQESDIIVRDIPNPYLVQQALAKLIK